MGGAQGKSVPKTASDSLRVGEHVWTFFHWSLFAFTKPFRSGYIYSTSLFLYWFLIEELLHVKLVDFPHLIPISGSTGLGFRWILENRNDPVETWFRSRNMHISGGVELTSLELTPAQMREAMHATHNIQTISAEIKSLYGDISESTIALYVLSLVPGKIKNLDQ